MELITGHGVRADKRKQFFTLGINALRNAWSSAVAVAPNSDGFKTGLDRLMSTSLEH